MAENIGPGAARQRGLESSFSNYIMFLDADDVFQNTYAIEYLRSELNKNENCAVFSSFVEEMDSNQKKIHSKDTTWLFGKMYRRDFLERNGIVFNDSRENEDRGFNCAVMLCSRKTNELPVAFVDKLTYCWTYNSNSITRKNNFEYKHRDLFGYVDNTLFALRIAASAGVSDRICNEQFFSTLIYLYFRYIENFKTQDYQFEDLFFLIKKYVQQFNFDKAKFKECSDFISALYKKQFGIFKEKPTFDIACLNQFKFGDFLTEFFG